MQQSEVGSFLRGGAKRSAALGLAVVTVVVVLMSCGGAGSAGGGNNGSEGTSITLPNDAFGHMVIEDRTTTMDGDFMVMVHLVSDNLSAAEAEDLVVGGSLAGSISGINYARIGLYDGDGTTPLKPGVYPVRLAPRGSDVASVFLATDVGYDFDAGVLLSLDYDAATPGEIAFGSAHVSEYTIVSGIVIVAQAGSDYALNIVLETESGDSISAGFSGPITSIARDYECGTSPTGPLYLYDAGQARVSDMGGSRHTIDTFVEYGLPNGLPGSDNTVYKTIGFISMGGDAIADFPANHCVPSDTPVIGFNPGDDSATRLADDWADLMDGTIEATVGPALGYQSFHYFWTGSNNDGTASGYDCDSWTRTDGTGAGISSRSDTTSDWLNEFNAAQCGSGYKLLGLAFCVENCSPP